MFVKVHDVNGNIILVNLLKAETIQDHFISFNNYGLNVIETFDELQNLLNELISNNSL